MRFEVRMFPGRRGETYLGAFVVWVVCLLPMIVRSGGSGDVTDLAGGLLLAVDFGSAAAIVVIACLITCDSDGRDGAGDPLRFALLVTLRCWSLLLGFGIPAAVGSLRRSL